MLVMRVLSKNCRYVCDNSSHNFDILFHSPTSELQFTRPGINQEASCSIKLTNDKAVSLAYKVRTTDPKNYKVRQGRGMLPPGHSDVVHVTLLPGQLYMFV